MSLNGTVSDDGNPNPPGVVTTQWSVVNGPGSVSFANSGAVATTATFSREGSYLLRLAANDSDLSASDDVTIQAVDASSGGSTFSVNSNLRHQTMVGWEAVAQVGIIGSSVSNAVAGLAAEVGINRVRLEVRSGEENPVDYFTPFINGQQPTPLSNWRAHR